MAHTHKNLYRLPAYQVYFKLTCSDGEATESASELYGWFSHKHQNRCRSRHNSGNNAD